MRKRQALAVAIVSAFFSTLAAADPLTDQAKALVEQGKSAEAFQLLSPLESERSGDVTYDLLLGIAAVEVGQNTRAVFALERVLALQPNNSRARAEIARAYLGLGETAAARQEFETVKKQDVPPEVGKTIDRLLDAVDRVEAVNQTTLRGYLELGIGIDSNVNAATASGTIPAFGGTITLDNNSQAQSAWYARYGGGLNYRTPINKEFALVAGASAYRRSNADAGEFDDVTGDLYGGLVLSRDKSVYSLTAQFNQYNLQSDRYRTASGLTGQWQYNHDARNQSSLFVQYSDLRYPLQVDRSAERWVYGGSHALAWRGGEIAFASLYGVSERARNDDFNWYGFAGYGVRGGVQWPMSASTVFFAGASFESRRYESSDPFFGTKRHDRQSDLVFGANYSPERLWRITPRLTWTDNASDLDLNKYHRTTFSVTVRRDF